MHPTSSEPKPTGDWKNVRVLVTGGASFIGSHLVDRLLEADADVRVADDFSSGTLANLAQSIDRIDLRTGDLRESEFTRDASADRQVVFHLAAKHGGRGFIDTHPADCASNLVLDGVVFAEALRAGVERVCFASSACVYPVGRQVRPADGSTRVLLQEPWADPFAVEGASSDGEYGWAKLMGEMALTAYHKQYGLNSVSCRLFTAYGERENETHAIVALIAKAFVGQEPFEIWGDGSQERNFTYVGDIVEGMMRAALRIEDSSAVNIGTAEHVRVIDAARTIFAIMGHEPEALNFDTSKPVGVYSRAADLTRTRELLDWEPTHGLEEGLRRTVEWYQRTHDRAEVAANLEMLLNERAPTPEGPPPVELVT
jgi:UDP-glucose 4-epimerase